MNPATAANTEANGISVSGPRYNCLLSLDVYAAAVIASCPTRRLAAAGGRHALPGNGIAFTLPLVVQALSCCSFPATVARTIGHPWPSLALANNSL